MNVSSPSINVISILWSHKLVVTILLIAITLVVYAPIRHHQFLQYDDDRYVVNDLRVRQGLTWENVIWSMTAFEEVLWKPVTLWSHMLDCQLFGLNPKGHLLMNLLFHALNTTLLLGVLQLMTGAFWPSALVAALFALHPLNVESVAWVAERKNVLSTLFWLLTMWAYVRYTKKSNWQRYLAVMVALTLGLMAKPMLVTLPCALLLMDYWPLGRFGQSWHQFKARWLSLVTEKVPLFVLAAASSVVTLYGGIASGSQGLPGLEEISLGARVNIAVVSYGLYLKKMLWPVDLAVLYPYWEGGVSTGKLFLAALALASVSFWVWKRRWKSEYLVVGWLWYLGTLFPVSGVLASGFQAIADRYTYVPLIGVFMMLAWGAAEMVENRHSIGKWLAGASVCVLTILALLTRLQLSYWQNNTTLFEHTLQVTSNNSLAHGALGSGLILEEEFQDAVEHLREAIRINPSFVEAHTDLGLALAKQGKLDEAAKSSSEALRLKSDFAAAHSNMGFIRFKQDRSAEAIEHFSKALEADPQLLDAWINIGSALSAQGRIDEAIESYREALRLAPDHAGTHYNLGVHLLKKGEEGEAIDHFSVALAVNPNFAAAHAYMGFIRSEQGRLEEAIEHFSKALELDPSNVGTRRNLGLLLQARGRTDEAIELLREALRLAPDDAVTHNNLGVALIKRGDTKEALCHFSEAIRIDPTYREAQENLTRLQSR